VKFQLASQHTQKQVDFSYPSAPPIWRRRWCSRRTCTGPSHKRALSSA